MTYGTPSTPALTRYTISIGAELASETVVTGSMEIVLETGSEAAADEMAQSIVDALSGVAGLAISARKQFSSLAVITPTEAPE